MSRTLVLCAALVSGAAFAETTENTGLEEKPKTALLTPIHVDAKIAVDTDILLVYINLAAAGDVAVAPIGPGTLAVGGGIDFGFCGSFCWLLSGLLTSALGTPSSYWQRHVFPNVRVTYHFKLPDSSAQTKIAKVNAYAMLFGGPVFTSLGLGANNRAVVVEGNDTSIGIGAGAGAQFFLTERFFVGAEVSFRYARGRYTWRLIAGSYSLSSQEESWDLSGFNVRLMAGVRI